MNVPEITKQLEDYVTKADIIIISAGILIFGIWLLKTSLGRNALADSVPRRNKMPVYLPFIPLFVWFGAVAAAISITGAIFTDLPNWQMAFIENFVICIGALAAMAVVVFLVRASFARGLKGFGLRVKTIHKDFGAALVNLFAVWPILVAMIILTTFFGKAVWGREFEIQQHQELEMITTYPQLSLRILIVVVAVVVAPLLEELLFRGLFQTMIRSFLSRPWLSIAISSGLFAVVHANAGHWPALFVLAVCLGYSYEKSGSLFRPIFIHSLFNGVTIIAALYGV